MIAKREKAVTLSNTIGLVAAICGVVLYFKVGHSWVIWCAAVSILSSVINVLFGDQNTLVSETIFIIAGLIAGLITKRPLVSMISLGICCENVFVTFIAPVLFLVIFGVITLASRLKSKITKSESVNHGVIFAIVCAIVAVVCIVIGSYHALVK